MKKKEITLIILKKLGRDQQRRLKKRLVEETRGGHCLETLLA